MKDLFLYGTGNLILGLLLGNSKQTPLVTFLSGISLVVLNFFIWFWGDNEQDSVHHHELEPAIGFHIPPAESDVEDESELVYGARTRIGFRQRQEN